MIPCMVLLAEGRSLNAAKHYNFSLVTLLRAIHQFTPFSVWRI